MSQKKDSFQLTIDAKRFVGLCLQDPATRAQVFDAIREFQTQQVLRSEPLGAINLGEEVDEWFTLFVGSNPQVSPGQDGFIYRNRKGDRVSLRLKRQQNNHMATVGDAGQVQVLSLLGRAQAGDREAAAALLEMVGKTKQLPTKTMGEALPVAEDNFDFSDVFSDDEPEYNIEDMEF